MEGGGRAKGAARSLPAPNWRFGLGPESEVLGLPLKHFLSKAEAGIPNLMPIQHLLNTFTPFVLRYRPPEDASGEFTCLEEGGLKGPLSNSNVLQIEFPELSFVSFGLQGAPTPHAPPTLPLRMRSSTRSDVLPQARESARRRSLCVFFPCNIRGFRVGRKRTNQYLDPPVHLLFACAV